MPTAQVSAKTRPVSMPMSDATALSCAVARMTLPVYDQRRKAKSAAVQSTATAKAISWARLSTALPMRTTTE